MLRVVAFTARTGWARVADLARISELLEDPDVLLWATADTGDLSSEDIAMLSEEFALHPLALEDAMTPRQRPKAEGYPRHRFIVAHELHDVDGKIGAQQIACFVGERSVLVLHAGAQRTLDEARARLQRPRQISASLILHAILDVLVDGYERLANDLEAEVEVLEDHMLERAHEHHAGLFALRRRMTQLRRFAVPHERFLGAMLAGPDAADAPESFRDVHDHALRVLDTLRSSTDVAEALFDLQRAEQSRQLSEITKRLSGWAAIIAVPTMIASVYGMNFALIPKEGSMLGFVVATGSMLVSGLGLFLVMRMRRWI